MNTPTEILTLRKAFQLFPPPSNYLVIDFETTGFSRARDLIIDVGWLVVKDNQPVHSCSLLLDWTKHSISPRFIEEQMAKQAAQYAKKNQPHYYPASRLRDEGEHPITVLSALHQLICDHIRLGEGTIVGHNFWFFDREMLGAILKRFAPHMTIPWTLNSILDTGLIEKAIQNDSAPWPGDTADRWFDRISHTSSKTKFSLSGHCDQKYQLSQRHQLDIKLAHTAAFDCYLTHYLLQTFKQVAGIST